MVSGIASTAGFTEDARPWCFDEEPDLCDFIESEAVGLIDFVFDLKHRVFYRCASQREKSLRENNSV